MDALISEKTLRGEIIGVSRVTWWTWQKQGKPLPPSIKIGKSRYYKRDTVETWLAEIEAAELIKNTTTL